MTMSLDWQQFKQQLADQMSQTGWPTYFLITEETMQLIKDEANRQPAASTTGHSLELTHILGIPFEVCPPSEMSRRAAYLSMRGKIVWQIQAGDQHDDRSGPSSS
jgi:hypothetical protein